MVSKGHDNHVNSLITLISPNCEHSLVYPALPGNAAEVGWDQMAGMRCKGLLSCKMCLEPYVQKGICVRWGGIRGAYSGNTKGLRSGGLSQRIWCSLTVWTFHSYPLVTLETGWWSWNWRDICSVPVWLVLYSDKVAVGLKTHAGEILMPLRLYPWSQFLLHPTASSKLRTKSS